MATKEEQEAARAEYDIRPQARRANEGRGPWIFAGLAAMGALGLFTALEARREAVVAPSISAVANDPPGLVSSAPELFIPPRYVLGEATGAPEAIGGVAPSQEGANMVAADQAVRQQPLASPVPIRQNPAADINRPWPTPYAPPPPINPPAPSFARNAAATGAADFGNPGERVTARRFANPATTVPKGTIVQAVLETALDSTRPGFARALISRDVFSFDGSRVLIPKGSRLIGEYKADLASGQKRALIQWQRLMRPDGVIVDIDSPAADQLGRAGVLGKVNSHFFARFGEAILQSVLNLGTQVAVHEVTDGSVVYAIPIPAQGAPVSSSRQVQPTLKVKQGTSVSVFVAKDLDFTTVSR